MEQRRVCFACVNVCGAGGWVCGGRLVQMQAFSSFVLFFPELPARGSGEREAVPKEGLNRLFFTDRETRRELLASGVQLVHYHTLREQSG